jgi:hypothetical protein
MTNIEKQWEIMKNREQEEKQWTIEKNKEHHEK